MKKVGWILFWFDLVASELWLWYYDTMILWWPEYRRVFSSTEAELKIKDTSPEYVTLRDGVPIQKLPKYRHCLNIKSLVSNSINRVLELAAPLHCTMWKLQWGSGNRIFSIFREKCHFHFLIQLVLLNSLCSKVGNFGNISENIWNFYIFQTKKRTFWVLGEEC